MTLPAEDLQPARYYIPPSLSHQSFILVLNHLLSQTQSHSQFSTDRTSPFGSSEKSVAFVYLLFYPFLLIVNSILLHPEGELNLNIFRSLTSNPQEVHLPPN